MSATVRSHHPPDPTPPLNQSCENCRALKVRCLPDPNIAHQCQRCTRTRRTCVFAHTLRRQPRKKTGSRVAQLEKDVRDLRALLHEQNGSNTAAAAATIASPVSETISARAAATTPFVSVTSDSARIQATSSSGPPRPTVTSPTAHSSSHVSTTGSIFMGSSVGSGDVVDRGILSLETAQMLLSVFISDLTQYFPVVVLPEGTDADFLRGTKPVLFLSIIAAASLTLETPHATALHEELLAAVAGRFFLRQEKSLELVQALLIMLIYYLPPKSAIHGQYYQYTHIATTMALELGIVAGAVGRKNQRCHAGEGELPATIHSDQARAVLGCYHFASNVGMQTRRPNMLCYNAVIGGYVKHLGASPGNLDQQLAAWFGLQRIMDETLAAAGHDNTLTDTPMLESQMLPILKWFDTRMLQWKISTPKEMLTTWMTLEYHYLYLAIHEQAAGEGYRDPDAPTRRYYTLPPLEGNTERHRANVPLSAARVQIITKWMLSAQQLLDFFLQCDVPTMRKLPNMTYTRMILGVSSLLRIYYMTQLGPLSEVITPQMINVDEYLDRLSQALSEACDNQRFRVPSKWHHVVAVKNREWYEQLQRRLAACSVDNYSYLRGVFPSSTSTSAVPSAAPPGVLPSLVPGAAPAYMESWYADDPTARADAARGIPAVGGGAAPMLYLSPMQPVPGTVEGGGHFATPAGHPAWRLDESLPDLSFPY
ncbi:Zn(II)2Cys6 transcription factor [Aspergillus homomorphus CBS 101889]|uniref:C6 zinc finger domain protein n=1 Tax=Aspergillus homomorphus (strain CBS 101889) TaxID=1450537 RepID=A0A395HW12_ASPHC|nr:C6 zinc finger domain protein [Aspergillus homomorphus CBS 101889]RAL11716.1 C6 zinc finger domain protein [Aspergillus homomorphus CBS 101889]